MTGFIGRKRTNLRRLPPGESHHVLWIRSLGVVSLPVPPTIERPAPDPPPRRRLGGLILLVAALVAGVTVVVIGLDGPDRPPAPAAPPPGFEVPELDVAP